MATAGPLAHQARFGLGNNGGSKEVFLAPGIMVGELHLWQRLGFSFGGGIQFAATEFHRYNHAGVVSVRFPF